MSVCQSWRSCSVQVQAPAVTSSAGGPLPLHSPSCGRKLVPLQAATPALDRCDSYLSGPWTLVGPETWALSQPFSQSHLLPFIPLPLPRSSHNHPLLGDSSSVLGGLLPPIYSPPSHRGALLNPGLTSSFLPKCFHNRTPALITPVLPG